ncbi:hypothetical protein HMPREF9136_1397 [Prevotella dentalis DSM 3688]|uniref:Uncharacterized protein n=1 Tax=Prevotella dentalis (strain ATCC 49559 / DSM 3688 / JCM 13448 / NCTC 12043 / ES 2772) TaxID=908937 RepID=F9D3G9_PREDD|nr:hypothetical protein HMPREF9136_1397 [Prevotella dentalis DSM 3688]
MSTHWNALSTHRHQPFSNFGTGYTAIAKSLTPKPGHGRARMPGLYI